MLGWWLLGLLACGGGEPTPEDAPASPEKVAKAKGKVKAKTKGKQPAAAPTELVKVQVWFVDSKAQAEGTEPVLVAVEREVGAKMPEKNAVYNLFKGPTEEEAARGLVMVKSGAEGFEGFTLENKVARLKLRGGCASEGSALTVYDLIHKTLTTMESVEKVQLLGPADAAAPEGVDDHRPDCLQP